MYQHKPKIDLVVIGIIMLVLILVIGWVVGRRDIFKETRNISRQNHMQLLMTAIYVYASEHEGNFPDCLPEPNQPAVDLKECYNEIRPYLMHLELIEPDPEHAYMIEYVSRGDALRIFSTSPEAKNLEVIR